MIKIRPARPEDYLNISVLVVNAFRQPNESNLIRTLRATGDVAVELVAEDRKGLVGHVVLSRMRTPTNWLALGPVCVRPENARRGIGHELILNGLDMARQGKFDAVVVVGDPDYYHRFGFVFDGPAELVTPYPRQYTGFYPIAPGIAATRAVLVYPDAFGEV